MMIRRFSALLGCLSILFVPLSAPVLAEEAPNFSRAETILWMTDQLESIEQPVELSYRFEKSGTFEAGFADTVRFVINDVKSNGMKSATLYFFSGKRQFKVPPADNTNVNPILKVYLQGDVYEMNRLTDTDGTSRERWRYFQRRIKFALADAAEVSETVIRFDGKEYSGYEVTFSPYVNDPRRQLFDQFADKKYTVTVSDDLPGYLYRIETIIPSPSDELGAPPLIRELLQLEAVVVQDKPST